MLDPDGKIQMVYALKGIYTHIFVDVSPWNLRVRAHKNLSFCVINNSRVPYRIGHLIVFKLVLILNQTRLILVFFGRSFSFIGCFYVIEQIVHLRLI